MKHRITTPQWIQELRARLNAEKKAAKAKRAQEKLGKKRAQIFAKLPAENARNRWKDAWNERLARDERHDHENR